MSVAAKLLAGAAAQPKAWNVGRAEYVRNFSVASQDTSPQGVFFKPDGTKMYVLGDAGDDVNQYRLSTPWDVTSAVYVRNFSVAAQTTAPRDLFFKPDGLKMYVVWSDTSNAIREYTLSVPWDISSAQYTQAGGGITLPGGLFFKSDGTKVYITSNSIGDRRGVHSYNLSSAWDVSSAGFSFIADLLLTYNPTSLFFKPDGTRMYVVDGDNDTVNQYKLSSAWDVSTATYIKSFSVTSEETAPTGLHFHPDGSRMYVVGTDGDEVNEYRLSTVERSAAFSTAGTHSFTVPSTITSVTIDLVGGEGGGASGGTTVSGDKNPVTTNFFGGDGGSGALATKVLSVTPGETLTIVVGSGGAGGAAPSIENVGVNPGSDGTDSTVTQSASVVARADAGSGAPSTTDGAGGLAAASTGDTTTNGVAGFGGAGGFGAFQSGSAGETGSVSITW